MQGSSSYHDRGVTGFEGSGVDPFLPRTYPSSGFPPQMSEYPQQGSGFDSHVSGYVPQGSVFSGGMSGSRGDQPAVISAPVPSHPPAAPSNYLQWVTQQLESWFGSTERFERNFVQISRLVLVDCVMYPFIVFSHQCQLFPYNTVSPRVTAPFSTLVVMNNILSVQGVAALWRGWRSHTFQLVATPFLGALLAKLFSITSETSRGIKYFLRTLVVKSLPHFVLLPLASYTYIDMVQTTKDSEYKEGVLQLARERPLFNQDELRRIPFLYLATPTILHGLLSGAISFIVLQGLRRIFRTPTTPPHESKQLPLSSAVGALWMDYFSFFLTEVLLYPLETVLVRLHCQGMPALVDNIQNGLEGSFVSSYYGGVVDCVRGVWDSEGPLGFFKGFSSLLIRYSIHGFILLALWRTAQVLETRLSRTPR